MSTDRKRTIEARLDKLKKRLAANETAQPTVLRDVLKGMLDLLRDVLLTDEPAPPTREQAEALTKRAT